MATIPMKLSHALLNRLEFEMQKREHPAGHDAGLIEFLRTATINALSLELQLENKTCDKVHLTVEASSHHYGNEERRVLKINGVVVAREGDVCPCPDVGPMLWDGPAFNRVVQMMGQYKPKG